MVHLFKGPAASCKVVTPNFRILFALLPGTPNKDPADHPPFYLAIGFSSLGPMSPLRICVGVALVFGCEPR